jgi:hypothetical protein
MLLLLLPQVLVGCWPQPKQRCLSLGRSRGC